ncbi:MAG: Fe-S cluster assembly ATPase SufC [Leptospirales bacterium]
MSENVLLEITNLHAEYVNNQEDNESIKILNGINLVIEQGKTHAIMGPNGSGKSTLSAVLMGHPAYKITEGEIRFKNPESGQLESILELEPHERARLGMFLSFQSPVSIPGLPVSLFLRNSLKNIRGKDIPVREFRKELKENLSALEMNPELTKRYLNEGFSGGEKKRMEILQLSLIKPALAILDEIDSGLDIDALRQVSNGINRLVDANRSFVLITHYKRLLEYVKPDKVHILSKGRIIKEGGNELVETLEKDGYEAFVKAAEVA